ncbi:SDR family oxidoreductase [Herbaspirillum sp. VT-16-41]|uniref:SDR family oxidoreductase n=1 Tax=Herbaspirillum sp. VT-16-41 TaxID=1953765 RepID=UPI000980E9E8|nr:SDR family oxidoreductase [Herbaspirillum sp. VT-16-41]ONN66089.1 short-chain dehydrogenase [Herbaspirillum sp. VT-16-41]
MKLENAVVLVTGANRGLGLEFAKQALERGARRVYAGARDIASVKLAGVEPIALDVTKPEQVKAAVERIGDLSVLINNAGIARVGGLLHAGAQEQLQDHLNTNLFGMLNLSQAFAPVLARQGGGALVNVLSVISMVNSPMLAAYGVSKAAAWSLTNGLRQELREQGTQVMGVHAGFIDTDLTRGFDAPKSRPEDVVRQTLDALEAGALEVFVDEVSRQVHQALSSSVYLQDALAR